MFISVYPKGARLRLYPDSKRDMMNPAGERGQTDMISVALVEDTREDMLRFQTVFDAYRRNDENEWSLDVFETGDSFLAHFGGQYDLIFLDIELPDMNGIDIGHRIRKKDTRVVLVYLTKMGQFAINGYEVDAADYILKPLDEKIFPVKMKKIVRRVFQNKPSCFTVSVNGGKRLIESDQILYVEVLKHDLTYHTANGSCTERGTLKSAEALLRNACFVRLSNCYLVNMRHITGVDKYTLTLDNGETLQISRSRKKEFADIFSRYLGGSL